MPGINVTSVTPYRYKFKALRDAVERGTVTATVKANLSLPDGTPINISTTGVIIEAVATTGVPNGLTLGNIVGGATDTAESVEVLALAVGDRLRGTWVDAIPSAWYGAVVGMLKGSGSEGWKFKTSGFAAGSDIFKVVNLRGAAVGDENAEIEVEKTA